MTVLQMFVMCWILFGGALAAGAVQALVVTRLLTLRKRRLHAVDRAFYLAEAER